VAAECRESWQIVVNARFSGGARNTGVTSVAACLQLCMTTTDCHAVDYNADLDECWVHTDVGDLTQTITAPGYSQYLQLSQCDQGTIDVSRDLPTLLWI